MTLPRSARALASLAAEEPVCGRPDHMQLPDSDLRFPVVTLMREAELDRREQAIRDNPALDPAQQAAWIANLNGRVWRMSVDAQRRIVLPAHFVDFLHLEREVYMFSTNVTVLAWNPDDWQRWNQAQEEATAGDSAPPPFLSV